MIPIEVHTRSLLYAFPGFFDKQNAVKLECKLLSVRGYPNKSSKTLTPAALRSVRECDMEWRISSQGLRAWYLQKPVLDAGRAWHFMPYMVYSPRANGDKISLRRHATSGHGARIHSTLLSVSGAMMMGMSVYCATWYTDIQRGRQAIFWNCSSREYGANDIQLQRLHTSGRLQLRFEAHMGVHIASVRHPMMSCSRC